MFGINQGGIRNLFRYLSFSLYSVIIVCYVIFSFFAFLIGDGDLEKIENNAFSNLVVEYSLKENSALNVVSNSVKNNLEQAELAQSNVETEKRIAKNTNQFLHDGSNFNLQLKTVEVISDDEVVESDKFDIVKIIDDLNLQKEKRVAVVAKQLGVDWENEKLEYAKLAGIEGEYNGSLDHNMKIRDYLIYNAQEIYKEKHGWNEWDTLPLVAKAEEKVKMNSKEITGQVTYNDVTLKVSAPVESFPEGTVLKIKTLEDDDSMTTFDITLKEVILMTQVDNVELDAPMASFDISFYAPDDTEFLEELQPAEGKYVSVVFDYTDNDEFTTPKDEGLLAVYHMEDNDYTSYATLVDVKDSEETKKTKSDSIGIYANALSVYILTVVSDLDEESSQNNKIMMFDAGTGGFIVENESIVLETTGTTSDIITGKILSKDDAITLPDVKVASGNRFGGWYRDNKFLGNAGDLFKLGDFNGTETGESDLNIEDYKFELYACAYVEGLSGDVCSLSESKELDENQGEENISEESVTEKLLTLGASAYSPSTEEIEKYGQEMFDAYNRAISNGITTIDDINKAKLNTKITRAELAKMMVVFMSGTLEKDPIITGSTVYKDVNKEKLGDLADYVQLAYQYQIMGINADGTPMENFNPNKPVSRGEFATVLSRVLYGDTYNQNGDKYYEKHIEALNKANILNNSDHNITEWRGWIITMLYRTTL